MKQPDVSIVIVTYNSAEYIGNCIASILSQTKRSCEIIVVDNASTDGTLERIKEKYPSVLLISNAGNAGFARANNQGFAVGTGRYFFLLNPDTLILDEAIDELVQYMDRNPDAGICGPKNVGPDLSLQYNCDHFPNILMQLTIYFHLDKIFPGFRWTNRFLMKYWNYDEIKSVDRIQGCSLLIRSELYRLIGGLDNNYFMYFEETDLCYRVHKEGYKIVYYPDARIIHFGGESSKTVAEEKQVFYATIYEYLPGIGKPTETGSPYFQGETAHAVSLAYLGPNILQDS
jgi:GT2 family glycosyltransferase